MANAKQLKKGRQGGITTYRTGVRGSAAGISKKRSTIWLQEDVHKALQVWAIENESGFSDAIEFAVAKLLKLI